MSSNNKERRGSYQKCNYSANVDFDDGSDVEPNHTSSFCQQQVEMLRRHPNGRLMLYFAISVSIGWILASVASIIKNRHYEKLPTNATSATVHIPDLIWSDEFDGDSIDLTKWSFVNGNGCDVGLCGWGNNELEWYTPSNTHITDGKLVIEARKFYTAEGPSSYTSSKIISRGKADFGLADTTTDHAELNTIGNSFITSRRFEASLRLPWGHGIWPAFWMLPTFDTYGGWPKSGEIDIMENIGKEGPNTVHGTVHYGLDGPQHQYSESGITIATADLNSSFHTYAVERHSGAMHWYVDDIEYSSITREDMKPYLWPFDEEFYFIINLAVGGNWPGNPVDSTNSTEEVTAFPQQLAVDYVRVYEAVFPRLVGKNIVKCKERGVLYKITNLDRISENEDIAYSWTIPDGVTIIEGEGTSSIRVDFDSLVFENNILDSEVIRVQAFGLTSRQAAHSIGLAKLRAGIGLRIKVVDYDGECSGNASSVNPVPRFNFDCGRPDTCTQYVLHRTTDEFTCGERIQWLMTEKDMDETDACREVGYRQFHGHCGPCNPISANYENISSRRPSNE